jgi:hypothetical protein
MPPMTVTEAFQTFKSGLELPDRKQKEAASAQQDIRSRITKYLFVADSVLTGSYSRYTKIDPLNDIDILLIRNTTRTGLSTDGSGVFPSQALDDVVNAVQQAYPGMATIKKQSRSANVQMPGVDFGFDLIPAWLRQPGGYWIPDSESATWIPTDPEAHARIMTEINDRCGGKLKPLIKMVKHWSRNNYDLIRSFHLELICADIFSREKLTNFPVGVATVLLRLPGYVGGQFMDPIYGVSRVDKSLSPDEQSQLNLRINFDAQRSLDALNLEAGGQHGAAIEKWKYIFMSGFPQ